jgi:hypothetical protein
MTGRQFGRIVKMSIVGRGEKIVDVGPRVGIKHQCDFSAMINGYKPWPEDVKQRLIDELNLKPFITWYEKDRQRRIGKRQSGESILLSG